MDIDIIRAWKDQNYRASLSDEELALLPANPIGQIELADDELKNVSGAHSHIGYASHGGCSSSYSGCHSSYSGC